MTVTCPSELAADADRQLRGGGPGLTTSAVEAVAAIADRRRLHCSIFAFRSGEDDYPRAGLQVAFVAARKGDDLGLGRQRDLGSCPLWVTVMTPPCTPWTTWRLTAPFVILLSGRRSQFMRPSAVPRRSSGKM